MRKLILSVLIIGSAISPTFATGFSVVASVTRIESSYLPDHINLRFDAAAGACPAGTWLFYYGNGATEQDRKDSVKASYAGLLAALHGGKNVEIIGNDTGCLISQIHLLN